MAATRSDLRALRALLALAAALFYAGPLAAQDPRASLVQEKARMWLADTDRGNAAQSWKNAGKQFRDAITAERWAESLKGVRPPLGALSQRAQLGTQFRKNIPGAPDGEYAIVLFRTTFAKKMDARETLTLEHEPDGAWRVIGYLIQ
ncbi:MAG TPA: DUF4019 domain-containing protein [Casimicrobiaceae bacterium]|nr:DUF4019 domain-containing protein [Casimicrobiaceae bacterium]